MGIFQGQVTQFAWGLLSPIASGTGVFYNIGDLSDNPFQGPSTVPFSLYTLPSPSGPSLFLSIDLKNVWSNAKQTNFRFDKLTSQDGWPYGVWTGLNGGWGSACGEVTLACSRYGVKIH